MNHDMRHPRPPMTPEEQHAYWNHEVDTRFTGLLWAIEQRVLVNQQIRNSILQRADAPTEELEIVDSSATYTNDPAYLDSFTD